MTYSRQPSFGRSGFDRVVWTLLALLILAGMADPGLLRAQGFGPDPYRPYNSQYDPFVYPVAPGPLDYGQSQNLNRGGVRGANQFDNYLNAITGPGVRPPLPDLGSPYYRGANRAIEPGGRMDYRPNRDVDAKFASDQEMVTNLYFKYLREKDPKKRADLFRQYSQARNRMGRDLASPRSTGSRTGTAARPGRRGGASDTAGAAPARSTTDRSGYARRPDSAPPPVPSGRGRVREGADDEVPSLGPAPPPIPRSSRRGSGGAGGVLPSDVLERAERPRGGTRVRGPRPPSVIPRAPEIPSLPSDNPDTP
jgi:hypothetical protein